MEIHQYGMGRRVRAICELQSSFSVDGVEVTTKGTAFVAHHAWRWIDFHLCKAAQDQVGPSRGTASLKRDGERAWSNGLPQ